MTSVPHSSTAPPTTPPTAAPADAPMSAEGAASSAPATRTGSMAAITLPPSSTSGRASTAPRLARGDIPSTWSKPAESVSTLPTAVPRPALPVLIVLLATVACVAVALALRPSDNVPVRVPVRVPDPPAVVPVAPVAPVVTPIEDIPLPPPTSSTTPGDVAPEDQGGSAVSEAPDVVTMLPARKKAKDLVARSEVMLLKNDAANAEPLLRRAAALDPSFPDAWRNLGIARAQLGDTDGARTAYRRYITLAPDAPDAPDVRRILADQ